MTPVEKTLSDSFPAVASNAYRMLGLPASASAVSIRNAVQSLKRSMKLGDNLQRPWQFPFLGEFARSENALRECESRLKNPRQRLRERLFWFHEGDFWSEIWQDALANKAVDFHTARYAAFTHDNALFSLTITAIQDPGFCDEERWIRALSAWAAVEQDKEYWDTLRQAETDGEFEPAASESELDELRRELPRLVCESLADGARRALVAGEDATCMRILNVFRRSKLPGNLAEEFEAGIFRPRENAVIELCEEVRNVSGTVVNRTNEFSTPAEREATLAANWAVCMKARDRFDKEVEPTLEEMIKFVGRNTEVGKRVRTATATALGGIGLDMTWADQFIEAEILLKRALAIAEGTSLAPRMAENLEKVSKDAEIERKQAHRKRIMAGLKPIKSLPSLSTINGIGLRLYGRSDVDAETSTYMATYYFVFFYIPILPICRYRVSLVGQNQYRFFGKAPLRNFDRWHIVVAIGAVVFFFWNVSQSPSAQNSTRNVTATAQNRYAAPSGSYSYNTHTSAVASPNYKQAQRDSLNSRINLGRGEIATLETKIRTIDAEMESTKAEIDSYNQKIQQYQRDAQLGLDVNEYAYGRVLRDHNNLVPAYNQRLEERRQLYLRYEQLIEQDHAWVREYNSLVTQ